MRYVFILGFTGADPVSPSHSKAEIKGWAGSLVWLNILPEECTRRMSPTILAKKRQVMRESLKDGLRAWVQGHGIQAQKRKADEMEFTERRSVKILARRFTAKKLAMDDATNTVEKRAQVRWGRDAQSDSFNAAYAHPTRANVLGMKRFWEGVISAASS
ncbi:uncharacterized protein HMPREF1541_05748 [Cyphellophora europaea CBS 101466]|uniref:Uncharacterized protein n=1 Tax=Cyphellophora europaea (strain CBS 101466) TaxID=1220924 RepID=W2RSU6_CYPE1|nr:uncharacterized protein HMPREF1541_05748 [Cyphellophora europaea CBS 101466]ETN39522.1 hypothetical protein HMPREF1541_05748 [Cyphellophora europaea CBS 101466]